MCVPPPPKRNPPPYFSGPRKLEPQYSMVLIIREQDTLPVVPNRAGCGPNKKFPLVVTVSLFIRLVSNPDNYHRLIERYKCLLTLSFPWT